jgi:hypothetical protein
VQKVRRAVQKVGDEVVISPRASIQGADLLRMNIAWKSRAGCFMERDR